jgi:probable biosynthetic protein (TIGR04098 family)
VGRPPLTEADDGWLERVELVTPAMCGHNSQFISQLGDWTWDAVGAFCHMDPYTAVGSDGSPAYLSFSYFRVTASSGLCAEQLTFGDMLRVRSKVLSCGGDSVLTLHQVRRDRETGDSDAMSRPECDVTDFFRYDMPGSIHVENFNRWISRSRQDTNHTLRRAAPADFQAHHLDRVSDAHTPRRVFAQARRAAGFRAQGEPVPQERLSLSYRVDASRDLNGVGLLYFASYFSIVDWAALRMWQSLGRPVRRFLRRRVLDRQLCFIANADADDVLDVEVTVHHLVDPGDVDLVDTTLRHQDGSLLAVSRQRIQDADGGDDTGTCPRPS